MRNWIVMLSLGIAGLGVAVGLSGVTQANAPQVQVPQSAAQVTLSYAPVVQQVVPSVVNIYAKRLVQQGRSPFADDPFFSQFFGEMRSRPRMQNSLGSGVILGGENIVVSNYHVVGQATDIRVVLSDKREFRAEMIFGDPETDLAVLRLLDAPPLPGLEFADSDAAQVGDLVLAVGNPFGVGQTVSSGIVSALARTGQVAGKSGYFIQTDAPINPGISGGALVDMNGQLIGINTAIVTRSGGSNGIGFAIPANLVRQYVGQAEAGMTELRSPWAGIAVQPIDGPLAEALGLERPEGVLVSSLHAQSPFALAGLEVGDIITAVDGRAVDGGPEMHFRLLTLGIGQEAHVSYLRDLRPQSARITLEVAPELPARDTLTVRARSILDGLTVANLNPALVTEMGLPFEAEGVVVTGVEGLSRRTQLRPGDVLREINGVAVRSPAVVAQAARSGASVLDLRFERGGQRVGLRLRNR